MSRKVFTETDSSGNTRRFTVDHYIYTAEIATLAPGATLTTNIQVEANSNFVWVKSSFAALTGGALTDAPQVKNAIIDSGSGLNLQNIPVDLTALAGQRGLPLVLPQEREFNANSNVQFTFQNYSAATTYDRVSLALIGYKKFYL